MRNALSTCFMAYGWNMSAEYSPKVMTDLVLKMFTAPSTSITSTSGESVLIQLKALKHATRSDLVPDCIFPILKMLVAHLGYHAQRMNHDIHHASGMTHTTEQTKNSLFF